MKNQFQAAFVLLAAATAIAGCGGGGASAGGGPAPGGGGPTPTATPTGGGTTPTPTPTGGGATPTPTPTPGGTATPNIGDHPAANGDRFTLSGTLLITYDRSHQYPTPEPTSTTLMNVTQTVVVTNPATFSGNGQSGIDFNVSEIDNQTKPAAQTFSEAVDNFYKFSNTPLSGNFLYFGYNSIDDTGYSVQLINAATDQLADILPESAGQSWTNDDAHEIKTSDTSNQTSDQTVAGNGSYTETITYQNAPNPSPNPTGSQLTNTATITARTDGSADYFTPRLGNALQYNYHYQIHAPTAAGSSGTISETTTIPPAVGSTAGPTTSSTTIPNWIPTTFPSGVISVESDADGGPATLPGVCSGALPASTPNQLVQVHQWIDPMGEYDVDTTTTYVVPNIGPVCVVIHDVQQLFYDFSGQNGTGYFSATPQQTTTIDEVLVLTAETVASTQRRSAERSAFTSAFRVGTAQARIAAGRYAARLRRFEGRTIGRTSYRGAL